MKLKRFFGFLLAFIYLFAGFITAEAQRYVADRLLADSVTLYNLKIAKGDTLLLDEAMNIPNGDTLTYRGLTDHSLYAAMYYKGELYAVHHEDLKYCENNPSNLYNHLQGREVKLRHTPFGYFFHSKTPYYLTAIIIAIIAILSFALRHFSLPTWLKRLFMIVVPLGLLASIILEFLSFILCNNFLWWINHDVTDIWKTLLPTLPVIAVAFLQVNLGLDYRATLIHESNKILSWRSAYIGLAACIPITILTTLALRATEMSLSDQDLVMLFTVLGTILLAFLICLVINIRGLGAFVGLAFTLFSFTYIVGVVLAVGLTLLVVFRLSITALAWVIPAILLVELNARSSIGKPEKKYEFNGKLYDSEYEVEKARKRYTMRMIEENKKRNQ